MIKIADGGKLIIKIDGDPKGFYDKTGDIDKFTNKALKNIAKGAAVTTAAIAAMGTMSIKSYADYEQLVGGVDTLFKESSKKLQGYAAEAYKTSGISANTYMQNATSFSASLLSSLAGDTEKAADIANMAMIDMSDNANKMGTPIENITTAYQGFAKQQYMLLDNLKLGYGGTKTEMERLLKDAEALSGVKYDINNLADVYEAIHVIQTELGITGTTAKEASSTITGSITMAKAAFDNLLTGIADPTQDIDVLVDNFVESVGAVIDNVMPRIKTVASELSSLLIKHMPEGFKIAISTVAAFGVALAGLKIGLVVNDIANLIKGVKGFTTATELGAAAQKVMNAQLLANPYALAATALAALTAGVVIYAATHKSAVSEIKKAYDEEIKAIDEATTAEMAQAEKTLHLTDTLFDLEKQLKSENLTEQEATKTKMQFDAVAQQLSETIPEITSAIYDENGAIDIQYGKVKALAASYYELAKAQAYAKAYEKKLDATYESMFEIEEELKNTPKKTDIIGALGTSVSFKDITNPVYTKLQEQYAELDKQAKGYLEEIAKLQEKSKDLTEGVVKGADKGASAVTSAARQATSSVEKETDKQAEILKAQREEELRDLKRLHESKEITDKEYYKRLAQYRDKYFEEGSDEWQQYTEEIGGYYQSLADDIYDTIDELSQAQKKLADKLKDYGNLYEEVTVESWLGEEATAFRLSDLSKQTENLKKYADALAAVKKRGNVPAEFFAELREMSVDEGLGYANLLLNADNATFNKYIEDWKAKQQTADEISNLLYADETGEVKKEIVSAFEEFNGDLEMLGEDNATSWIKSFLAEIKEHMPDVVSHINAAFSSLVAPHTMSLAGMANAAMTTYKSYSPTFNLYGSGETVTEQIQSAQNASMRDKLSGGY